MDRRVSGIVPRWLQTVWGSNIIQLDTVARWPPHAGDVRLDDLLSVLLAETPPADLECPLLYVRLLAVLLFVRRGLEQHCLCDRAVRHRCDAPRTAPPERRWVCPPRIWATGTPPCIASRVRRVPTNDANSHLNCCSRHSGSSCLWICISMIQCIHLTGEGPSPTVVNVWTPLITIACGDTDVAKYKFSHV